ncbi:RluA family pseudouridine synthase [Enterobacteriaceae bacterium ET-AT1-13]|nr:RluA family pseudouridine synthase [Enterobacteriaceae bacterium ET-AT1-13]WGS66442.1 RluA family pseudouridine synthase [Enterobacteriaceae bacterium Cmel17]WMC17467.1 MAG: RluA family pseudouridine synthase [Enterobacteriaceae bacterium Cmel21]WMC17674.1 MAG: RluA family pseudouridine synthase [Enterobacteriaceae bacterium PSmelAO3-2]WMC17878.1 MAG: RluA family pseudouridine synthase [Enterobacteriaceae bacterium PSmelAO3-1]WMC18082.1 MAG: RluA family pseudouridine synthase [Enterobacteri
MNKEEIKFIKINEKINQRIDNYLINKFKNISKNDIYKIIRKGSIRINKKRVNFSYRLKLNDIIRIKEKKNIKKTLFYLNNLEKNIIYEDNYILVIKKPSGISVHGGSGIKCGLIESIRILRGEKNFIELVHRLDKETSGILLLAKSKKSLIFLNKELKSKNIKKVYLALVHGKWNKKIKNIKLNIKKTLTINNKIISTINNYGKFSISFFEFIKNYNFNSLIKIYPITGRTHQIRLHLLYINNPIIFDKIYGIKKLDNKILNSKLNRLFLHSINICFKHPYIKKKIKVFSNIDYDLCYYLKKNK